MKEKLSGETYKHHDESAKAESYQQTYIAFPLKQGPLFDHVRTLNHKKSFPHFTLYFLDNLTDDNLQVVKEAILSKPDLFKDVYLKPQKMDTIGIHRKTLVIKIEQTPQLLEIRNHIEKNIPGYLNVNLPFLPHISIRKKYEGRLSKEGPDITNRIPPYYPTSVGVFYKTEEVTALLFSHKI